MLTTKYQAYIALDAMQWQRHVVDVVTDNIDHDDRVSEAIVDCTLIATERAASNNHPLLDFVEFLGV